MGLVLVRVYDLVSFAFMDELMQMPPVTRAPNTPGGCGAPTYICVTSGTLLVNLLSREKTGKTFFSQASYVVSKNLYQDIAKKDLLQSNSQLKSHDDFLHTSSKSVKV